VASLVGSPSKAAASSGAGDDQVGSQRDDLLDSDPGGRPAAPPGGRH